MSAKDFEKLFQIFSICRNFFFVSFSSKTVFQLPSLTMTLKYAFILFFRLITKCNSLLITTRRKNDTNFKKNKLFLQFLKTICTVTGYSCDVLQMMRNVSLPCCCLKLAFLV